MAKKTSVKSEKPKKGRLKRKLPALLIIVGLLVLLGSGFLWARQKFNDPETVFWAAIENNLRSLGATRHIVQKDGNISSNQLIQFTTGVPHIAKGTTSIKQDTQPPITITTETIGTPYKDFVRYTSAQTSQKQADGKTEDFSSIINIWGVSGSEEDSDLTGGQYYADSILNIIPSANLTFTQRQQVMSLMRDKVYTIDPNKVLKRSQDSRPQYVYAVSIDFESYITMLKQVADFVGLSQLDDVDPANFAGRPPVQIEVAIDVWSRTVSRLSTGGGSRAEAFVSRGITAPIVEVPTSTLPLEELQARINKIDQEQ